MISTFSLTGILSLGVILFISAIDGKKIRLLPMLGLFAIFIFTASYVVDRINSLSVKGSSANFRIVAPVAAILRLIPDNLIGIPLGSLELTVSKFGFLNGSKVGSSIDNGLLLLILYFGLIGILVVIMMIFYTIRLARVARKLEIEGWQMVLVPILTMNFNGGIFLPDYICVISFVIISIRVRMAEFQSENKGATYAR
jgi:hypothetical protein